MGHTATTPTIATAAGAVAHARDEEPEGLLISPSEIVDRIWRIATSVRTALVLMLGFAAIGLVGALVIQAPAGMTSDPQAYAAWLDSVRPKFGGWTGLLDTVGAFSIFSSIWFKALIVGLTTCIVACTVNRWKGMWKTAVHPRTKMTPAFYAHAPHSTTIDASGDPETALGRVRDALRGQRFRTVVEREDGVIHVYGDRWRWAPFGTFLDHLSLILILTGVLVGASWGFRDPGFTVAVGSKAPVGNGTGLTAEAVSFTDSYYVDTGAPSDYASDLVLYKDGTEVARQTVRVNQPLRYGDVTFYQSFFGAAAAVKVASPDGNVVYENGVPLAFESTDGKRRIGQFTLPDQGLTVFVVGAASGEVDPQIRPGQMQLEVYKTGTSSQPVAVQIVDQGKAARFAGLDFTFERERQFTGLIVARDPGAIFVWIGGTLLVVGLFVVFFLPSRRIWARIVPGRGGAGATIQVGATSRHNATFTADFARLVTEMERTLAGRAAS